ncbi:pectate lyase F [Verticillium dahliae]
MKVSSVYLSLLSSLAAVPSVSACNGYEGGLPSHTDHYSNSQVIEVPAGEVYDGKWAKYDRGSGACNEQNEGDWRDAVFYLRRGATLKNVIIGKDQAEGVHCDGPCTLEFVWFEDVCEDGISVVSATRQTWIIGGGAFKAQDKIVQHNGCGTVNIINFYAEDYGKVYRSCGNCSSQCKRNVYVEGVTAYNGGEIVGINEAFGDTATLRNVCTDAKEACWIYDGCAGGCSPEKVRPCSG